MRAWGLAVAAAATVALTSGCGSSGDSSEKSDAAQASTAAQTTGPGLSQRQYDELEKLLVATLPLEKVDATMDARQTRRALDRAADACSDVDRDDPLLAAMVDECESILASLATTDADCKSAAECAQVMRQLADTLEELVRTVRENQPTIVRSVPDRSCREVLLSPRETQLLAGTIPIYRRAAEAIATGDQDLFIDLQGDLDAIDARSKRLPSARQKLTDFRRFCRP